MSCPRGREPVRFPSCRPPDGCSPRSGPLPVVVFWHDEHGVRDRRPLPAPRLPAAPGNGRSRPRHLSLASRALRPRVGLHARPLGRRRARLRRRRPRRRRVRARARARRSRRPSADAAAQRARRRHLARGREVGARVCSTRACPASEIVRTGVEFGTRYRSSGWGAGLTVLVAMANLLPQLAPDDQALALVHGLTFVARDTRNHAPRFAVGALETQDGADRPPRRLVPPLRRHALVGRGRAHARDRARRARPPRPTSRR